MMSCSNSFVMVSLCSAMSCCLPISSSSSSFPNAIRSSRKVVLLRGPEMRRKGWSSCACGVAGAKMSEAKLESSLSVKKKASEILDDLKGTSIFLVGMNCTMKTNTGKILADSLRYYYFDSDSLVEEAAGGSAAAKSFREKDEKGFRDSETEVLKQLSSMGRLVVCAGDGAVQTPANLAFLRYGISIWINVPLDFIANEVPMTEGQSPLVQTAEDSDFFSQVLEKLSQQYTELKEGYATADATVSLQKVASELGYQDFASVTPEDMAVEVMKEIEKLTRVKKMMEAAARPF